MIKLKSLLKENVQDYFKVAAELEKITGFNSDKADSVISGFNVSASLSIKNKYRDAIKKKDYKKAAHIVKKYWRS